MAVLRTFKAGRRAVDHYAAPLLVGGVLAAVALNWRQWRRDLHAGEIFATAPDLAPVLSNTPLVSILLPAWNEAIHLAACMESIRRLRYPAVELVICAGGRDGSLDLAKRCAWPGVIVIEQQSGEGKQQALQHCFERASGSVIFLTDADCILDDECFERTLAPIVNDNAPAATGSRRPLEHQLEHPLVTFQLAYHLYLEGTLSPTANALYGINAAIRRDALEHIGGFATPVAIGTDFLMYQQLQEAGYQVSFVPGSRVQTEYLIDHRAYSRQQSRWFRNRFIHGWRFGAWDEVLVYLRGGLVALFMLGVPLTAGLRSRLLWSTWLVGICHLGLSTIRYTRFAMRFGGLRITRPWHYVNFAVYIVLSWVTFARGLVESLLPVLKGFW